MQIAVNTSEFCPKLVFFSFFLSKLFIEITRTNFHSLFPLKNFHANYENFAHFGANGSPGQAAQFCVELEKEPEVDLVQMALQERQKVFIYNK